MINKLSARLTAWFLLIFLFMFIFINTYCTDKIKSSITDTKISQLYTEAQTIGKEYMSNYYLNTIDLTSLKTQLKTVDTFIDVRIWAINQQGVIIADTRSDECDDSIQNINLADPDFLSKNYVVNTTINDSLSEPVLSVIYPINSGLEVNGYIVMLLPMESIETSTTEYMNIINMILYLFGGILILTLLFLYRSISLPMNKIKKGVKEFTDGNFSYQLSLSKHDDFYVTAQAVNYMATKLENLEEYQKNFIANISHDFRSPLTSIKGYVEALIDGTIPMELKDKYLNIILFEAERLTKLTSNLLTLNNVKYNGAFLTIVSFDINAVIKKTAEAFEGTGRKKKISIELLFSEPNMIVCADVDKIQQVLYNLIDNAIKFSPNNSIIHISTDERKDKALISIKDHGIGIPSDSIHKIWDRFYKTDVSRGKDKKGTGLGLSIVKEIITAHNENINVISTQGVGTEFFFTLPLVDDETE